MSTDFSIDSDHPLALELKSLRATVSRYQHEASSAAVKLQRHSLDTSYALERTQSLERENSRLLEELTVLRLHSEVAPQSAALQIPELTNALRHVSDKLSITEATLLQRTTELAHSASETTKAKAQLKALRELVSRARSREEEGRARERHLEISLRTVREESRISDLVVQEYADLVRSLTHKYPTITSIDTSVNGGHNPGGSSTLVDSLTEGKLGMRRLLEEFNKETDRLEAEILKLNSELAESQSLVKIEQASSERDRVRIAELELDLDKLRIDDETAAKMVSRYMKFSQTSNNALSTALENLKARHKATTSTLTAQIDYLQRCFFTEKRSSEKLRHALDDLSEDISRETYGRRREISLRLAYLGREENLAEMFRRWYRKATESHARVSSLDDAGQISDSFRTVLEESEGLLDTLNGQPALEEATPAALARILAAQDAVSTLVQELQVETDRRMGLERQLAHVQEAPPSLPVRSQASSRRVSLSESKHSTPEPSASPTQVDKNTSGQDEPTELEEVKAPLAETDHHREPVTVIIPADLPIHQPSPRSPEPIAPVTIIFPQEDDPSSSSSTPPSPTILSAPSLPDLSPSINSPTEEVVTPSLRARLVDDLAKVKDRYNQPQRSFRDCNLALKDLTRSLSLAPQSDTVDLVRIAVERLDDFNEDARVELEIRVADEERTTMAFETLLQVKGALATEEEADALRDIQAFIDGTDKAVSKAQQQFSRKLDDLTHDIASIKAFVHDLPSPDSSPATLRSATPWSALAAGILGSTSRPNSPAPTFGAVMTSPRLRHASSFSQPRKPSFGEMQDPLAALNLRIPMPAPAPPPAQKYNTLPSRNRTSSVMNMLGFGGSRSNLLHSPNLNPTPPPPTRKISLMHLNVDDGNTTEDEDALDDLE